MVNKEVKRKIGIGDELIPLEMAGTLSSIEAEGQKDSRMVEIKACKKGTKVYYRDTFGYAMHLKI